MRTGVFQGIRYYLRERIPSRQSILPVASTAIFLTYSWTLYVSFWKVPSWLFFLRLGQVVSIYAYAFLVNFAETILLVGASILLGMILPVKWWRENYVPMSVLLFVGFMVSFILSQSMFEPPGLGGMDFAAQLIWWCGTFAILLIFGILFLRFETLRGWITNFADRLVIFAFLFLPLTAVSLIVILVRTFL